MRADQDVHLARFGVLQHFFLLARGAKSAHHFDAHRKRRESPAKRLPVLEREHRGGRQHGHLPRIADGLERRAHGHFRLAVAHVAAEQPVHRLGGFHIALHFLDGTKLVRGFLEFEGILKFPLPVAVGRVGEAADGLALGVKLEKLIGHVGHRAADFFLARHPRSAAESVQRGSGATEGAVFLHQVHARQRNVEARFLRIGQEHELAGRTVGIHLAEAFEAANPVIDMDHVIAGLEVAEVAGKGGKLGAFAGPFSGRNGFEQIAVSINGEGNLGKRDALGKRRADESDCGQRSAHRFVGETAGSIITKLAEAVRQLVVAAKIGKALELAQGGAGDDHRLTRLDAAARLGEKCGDVAVITNSGLRRDNGGRGLGAPLERQVLKSELWLESEERLELVAVQIEECRLGAITAIRSGRALE